MDWGSQYQTLVPACPVENLLRPVLRYTNPTPAARAMKIVILSDSLGGWAARAAALRMEGQGSWG